MSSELLEALRAPISPDNPGGADLALSPELDEIRLARKGDDDALAQGDWVRELRIPQWPRVRDLCEGILRRRSKDLQVACWYVEAQTVLDGFTGLALGLKAVEAILDRFWNTCHPALEGASAEERGGRIEWLDANLALAVKQIPLTAEGTGSFSWLNWEEARNLENLGHRDPQAREAALAEGRISLETFQKAVIASGPAFLEQLQLKAQAALEGCRALQDLLERRFGPEGPGLEALAEAIQGCLDFMVQTRHRLHLPAAAPVVDAVPAGPGPALPTLPSGGATSRYEAILSLRATAAFFRATEPHSPVAFLVERAANWAEMPLETWLAEVIKDAPTLATLRELLSLKKMDAGKQL